MTLSCVDCELKGRVATVLVVGAFNLIGIMGANAEPEISAVQVADEVKQGSVITLSGKGFGQKPTAAPVFVDYVEETYEYGKPRSVYSNFEDGTIIEPASSDPQSLWAATTSSLPVRYDSEKVNARHQFDEARYHFYGENSWLGRPVIYGGESGWDTPYNNPQIYVSWWVKVDYNSTYYWRINPLQITGQFSPGELVTISGEVAGEYIGKDDDGLLNFVFPGHINANNLVNQNIRGVDSKASAVFPNLPRGGEGYGFESPGTKYIRIWDDPKSQGIRASLSLTDYYVSSTSNLSFGTGNIYQRREMDPDRWHHFEFEIDTSRGVVRSWFDGEMGGVGEFDPRAAFQDGFSPTIALIGNNAKQDKLQNLYISEIYMDSSIQRVIIGDAPNYEGLSHYEIQRPVFWDDGSVKFAVNLGALSPSSELYVYVFDESGTPNKQGFALCASVGCPSPPEPIQLQVN
jgi:hypothetical protein